MEINISINAPCAEEVLWQMRKFLQGESGKPAGVSAEQFSSTSTKSFEPEIVPPAKKRGRGPAKVKAEDVVDVAPNGDPVLHDADVVVEAARAATPTTLPSSEGPKHDATRQAAIAYNAKFGNDKLIELLKKFKNADGKPCSGPRELFRAGHADAFIARVEEELA